MKYKTKNNLQEVWNQLDNACGLIDNALTNLSVISNLPQELKDSLDKFDFGIIVSLKNKVEDLMNNES